MPDNARGHDLPSARHLADLHGFFKTASFAADGTALLTFKIPPEMKDRLVDISTNDGMALNLSVWETQLPEGEAWLAEALGLAAVNEEDLRESLVLQKEPRG